MRPEYIAEDIENMDSTCAETRRFAFMNITLCLLGKEPDIFDEDGCLHGMAGDELFDRCIEHYRRIGLFGKIDLLIMHKQLFLVEFRTDAYSIGTPPVYIPMARSANKA